MTTTPFFLLPLLVVFNPPLGAEHIGIISPHTFLALHHIEWDGDERAPRNVETTSGRIPGRSGEWLGQWNRTGLAGL